MTTVLDRRWTVREVTSNRRFMGYVTGYSLDSFGDSFFIAMLAWVVVTQSSSFVAGLVLFIGTLPAILLAPVGGWLADRWGSHVVVVVTMGLRLVVLLVWTIVAAVSALPLTLIVLVAVSYAALDGLHGPAMLSYSLGLLPSAAQRSAKRVGASAQRTAQLVATGISAALVTAVGEFGAGLAVLVVLTVVWGIFNLLRKSHRAQPELPEQLQGDERFRGRLTGGVKFLAAQPVLRRTIPLQTVVTTAVAAAVIVGVPLKIVSHHWAGGSYVLAAASYFAGLLVGTVLTLTAPADLRRQPLIAVGSGVLVGVAVAVMGVSSSVTLVAVSAGAAGVFLGPVGPVLSGLTNELVQLHEEREGTRLSGRVNAVIQMCMQVEPFGFILMGALTAAMGVDRGLALVGLLIVITGTWTMSSRAVRTA